ncbi:MAG: hypothetical protein PUH24_03970 [Prevotellaceae bacterium]|nr:hypothetical protein [Prevotella sp.]MDD7257422.1 hypothetical protein [Prevotellaceae bacterium]MDY6129977.1 hypothetical protein [Prevotella sp.]
MKNLSIRYIFLLVLGMFSLPNDAFAQDVKTLRDELRLATELLSYFPDSVDLRLKKASCNMQLQQWEYAKGEYDVVLEKNPKNIAALFYRAYTNEQLRRYNFARIDYENLLAIVPFHFEACLGLALLNQKDKRYTEAMDQINLLIQQNPENALAYAARAGMEKERQMYSLAEYDYSEAIKRDPTNKDYLLNRIDVLLLEKKYDKAKEELLALEKMGIARAALSELYKRIK